MSGSNAFYNTKRALVETGELSPRTFADYQRVTDLVAEAFSKTRLVEDLAPDDFAELRNRMAKRWGPHYLGKTIQVIRCLFKFAFDSAMIATPMRFGKADRRGDRFQ
jgi:hypothetical protein